MIDKTGSIQATVEARKSKGQGINTGIMSILNKIPLGKHKMDVAMKLREVMLINGILYNSEAWHGVTKAHIKALEAIDEDLLRKFLKSHSTTPKEFLYLEAGAVSIKWIIAQRRINFLKCILEKDSDELLLKVFKAQKEKPTTGDFVKLVEQDMSNLNVTYEDITKNTKSDLKQKLKISAKNACFEELKTKLLKHKKLKHIAYTTFEMQPYLRSPNLQDNEAHAIAALRSKCVKGVKSNFGAMFLNRIHCPLLCDEENPQVDTQEHLLTCKKIKNTNTNNLTIMSVFGSLSDQENIGRVVARILRERARIIDQIETEALSSRGPAQSQP